MTYVETERMLDALKSQGAILWYEIEWPKFAPKSYDISPVNYWAVFGDGYTQQATG